MKTLNLTTALLAIALCAGNAHAADPGTNVNHSWAPRPDDVKTSLTINYPNFAIIVKDLYSGNRVVDIKPNDPDYLPPQGIVEAVVQAAMVKNKDGVFTYDPHTAVLPTGYRRFNQNPEDAQVFERTSGAYENAQAYTDYVRYLQLESKADNLSAADRRVLLDYVVRTQKERNAATGAK